MTEWTILSILMMPLGVVAGIIFGALPGFAASTGIALLMPFSFFLSPFEGLVFLINLYIGSVYGGSIPAILLGIPGTPGASGQLFDSYVMARKGEPLQALALCTTASVMGSTLSILVFLLISPVVSRFALEFGPPEMFWVAMWGLTAAAAVKPGEVSRGFFAGALGLLFGTIGADPMVGDQRMSFGILELYQGIPFIPALVGLFCFSEMVLNLRTALAEGSPLEMTLTTKQIFRGVLLTLRHWKELLRSGMIGTIVGILPGAGAAVAAFIAYNTSRSFSKRPREYGTGIPEGVIAPSSADNATVGGALIPMMTLGVPGSAATAILLGFMMFHGLRPGPRLFFEQWNLLMHLSFALIIGSILLGFFGLLLSRYCSLILKVNNRILAPTVIVLTLLASVSSSGSTVDIFVMFAFGLLGIFMKIYRYPVTSMVLGIILGPIAETNLLQALRMGQGNPLLFFTRPLCLVMIGLCVASFAYPYFTLKRAKRVA